MFAIRSDLRPDIGPLLQQSLRSSVYKPIIDGLMLFPVAIIRYLIACSRTISVNQVELPYLSG
jgi:hypothetical protein